MAAFFVIFLLVSIAFHGYTIGSLWDGVRSRKISIYEAIAGTLMIFFLFVMGVSGMTYFFFPPAVG